MEKEGKSRKRQSNVTGQWSAILSNGHGLESDEPLCPSLDSDALKCPQSCLTETATGSTTACRARWASRVVAMCPLPQRALTSLSGPSM
jgi:hypothetical protein